MKQQYYDIDTVQTEMTHGEKVQRTTETVHETRFVCSITGLRESQSDDNSFAVVENHERSSQRQIVAPVIAQNCSYLQ